MLVVQGRTQNSSKCKRFVILASKGLQEARICATVVVSGALSGANQNGSEHDKRKNTI